MDAVRYAVETGKIIKAKTCSDCGSSGRLHAHHFAGYEVEHRLDVHWLCQPCHVVVHHGAAALDAVPT
jgi:hypothetical protein